MARLVVLSEGFTGRAFELKGDRITIGRLDDNAFSISEASISGHHCEIYLKGNEVIIKDLDSTNGTYINGEGISEAPLKAGQILRLGRIELRLEEGAGGAQPTPAAAPVAAAASSAKKVLDPRAMTQGVKLNELERGGQGVKIDNETFKKKDNKINRVFVFIGIILALVVVGLLIYAVVSPGSGNGQ